MSLENDYFRMQSIIKFSENNSQQKSFLNVACVRWYINQINENIKPKIEVNDLKYFNKTNPKNVFDIDQFLKYESEINPNERMQIPKVKITKLQRERTRELYSGVNYKKDLQTLLNLYAIVGNNNTQLSMPPIFDGIEMFGSPLNTHNIYCSPFHIEKLFGSLGSFFDFEPTKEQINSGVVFLCNPPFDEIIMSKMADKIINLVKIHNNTINFLITLPVWDPETQIKLNIKNYNTPFECLNKIRKSKIIKQHKILDRKIFKYYDYYNNKYSPVCYSHLITIGETIQPIDYFTKKWVNSVN